MCLLDAEASFCSSNRVCVDVVDAGRKDPAEVEGSSIGSNRIGEDLQWMHNGSDGLVGNLRLLSLIKFSGVPGLSVV